MLPAWGLGLDLWKDPQGLVPLESCQLGMCWLQDHLLQVIGWLLADTSSLFEVTQMCVTITQDCLEVSLKDKCFSVTIIMLVTVLLWYCKEFCF